MKATQEIHFEHIHFLLLKNDLILKIKIGKAYTLNWLAPLMDKVDRD